MSRKKLSRRQFVAATAMSSAALISAPYIRTAYAAGKLNIGFWDHWVPDANKASTALVNEWAEKEKVEVSIDYITSQGSKNTLTIASEGQAKSGHDILAMPTWWPHAQADLLEPMNDVMEPLIKQNGQVNGTVQYLGKAGDKWLGVPACIGSQIKGPCSRIDLMKKYAGIDVQEMYPAGSPPKADNWTTDTFLKAAEACKKGGFPFGIGLGVTSDSTDTAGAFFQAFGAQLVDAKGDITVKTDAVREALEFYKKLIRPAPGQSPSLMRRKSRNNAGRMASQRDRRDGLRRSFPISGASGISPGTRKLPRACWSICRNRLRLKSWWQRAAATTCRRSRSSRP
jgi:ABC-type glycerol-3-phosphate transport system substrate-binding protein